MVSRQEDILRLQSYIEGVDKEVTMILQSLQWDRKHLIESTPMLTCRYDLNHRIPPDKESHENECFLKTHGYSKEDKMLPDPFDMNSNTLVQLSKDDIKQIINNASQADPSFKKGVGCEGPEPLTVERLQATYSADERRAIHDAVVRAVPTCHDLTELMLLSASGEGESSHKKSRLEVLAELRNMRRRRTRYRRAVPSRNYSHTLRDLIATQMEMYTDAKAEVAKEMLQKDVKTENIDKIHQTVAFDKNPKRSSESRENKQQKQYPKYPRETCEERSYSIDKRYKDSYREKYSYRDKRKRGDDENKSESKYYPDDSHTDRNRKKHDRDEYSKDRSRRSYDYEGPRNAGGTYNNDKRSDKNTHKDRHRYSSAEARSRYNETYSYETEHDTMEIKPKKRHTDYSQDEKHKYPKKEERERHKYNKEYDYKSERGIANEFKSRRNKTETHRKETYGDESSSSSKRHRDSEMYNYPHSTNGKKHREES